MCNAIQNRIIEERLVEDERYDAMLRLRHNINEALGMPTPSVLESVAARKRNGPNRTDAKTAGDGDLPALPKTASGKGGPAKRIAAKERGLPKQAAASGSPKHKNSPEWDLVFGDGTIPEPKRKVGPIRTDVMALGDVERDPTAPIAPYIAPTKPVSGANPFPSLNPPMG